MKNESNNLELVTALRFQQPPSSGAAILFASFCRLTRERVNILFQAHLIHYFIFFHLVLNVLGYCSLVPSYRVHIVSSRPEMPVPILVLHLRKPIENHQTTFPLEYSHEF